MKRRVKNFYLFMFVLTSSVIFSCKKSDVSIQAVDDNQVVSKFLLIPPGTDPEVKRVIQRLESLNKKNGFLSTIAKKDGFARWNKVIYNITDSKKNPGSSKDTMIYIPLVLENESRVNAFIYAKLNGSISLQLHRSKEYKSYKAGDISTATDNAERLALQIMMLNNKVFGYKKFKLLDEKLFFGGESRRRGGSASLTISQNEHSLGARGFVPVEVTYCTTTDELLHCTNSGLCLSGVCDRCYLCVTPSVTNCVTTVHYYFVPNDDDGPLSGGDGGGGGGSNGGTTTTLNCNPNPLLDNGLPPCVKGNNTGWEEELTDVFPNNPCENVDSLMKTTAFKDAYQKLRDSTTRNYEKGIFFSDPFNPAPIIDEVWGDPDSLKIDISVWQPVDGFTHNHFNNSRRLSIFSADDLDAAYRLLRDGKMRDIKTFTFGVVTDSTSYIIMITDPAKFLQIGAAMLGNSTHLMENFAYQASPNGIQPGNPHALNEKNFVAKMQLLMPEGPNSPGGFAIFKGNSDITQFKRIKYDASTSSIVEVPCQ